MTTTQALRQRRHEREQERRQQRADAIKAAAFIIFALAAFAIAGTVDYKTEQADLAHWESMGVTIQRW